MTQKTNELDLKLKAFALFKLGEKSAREIAEELNIQYGKCLRWKKELEEAEISNEVETVLNADETIIKRVAEETKNEMQIIGVEAEAIEGELESANGKIERYKQLNDKLNLAAMTLANKINNVALNTSEPAELMILAEALAKLQESFFNKNTYTVNLFPGQDGQLSETDVSIFKGFKRA